MCNCTLDGNFCLQFCLKLTTLKFVELVQTAWRKHLNNARFALCHDDLLRVNLRLLFGLLTTISFRSKQVSEIVVQLELHLELIGHLNHLGSLITQFKPGVVSMKEFVPGIVLILENILFKVESSREVLQGCDTVKVLVPYQSEDNKPLCVRIHIIIASLMTNEELDVVNFDVEIFTELSRILETSLNPPLVSCVYSLTSIDLVKLMNKLAANDLNKEHIVQAGALPLYAKLLPSERPKEEQKETAHGLWILASKCKHDIRAEYGCREGMS